MILKTRYLDVDNLLQSPESNSSAVRTIPPAATGLIKNRPLWKRTNILGSMFSELFLTLIWKYVIWISVLFKISCLLLSSGNYLDQSRRCWDQPYGLQASALQKQIEKQSVSDACWLLLVAFSKIFEKRHVLEISWFSSQKINQNRKLSRNY